MRTLFSIFLLLSSVLGFSQTNLVPNPSFEDYSSCPTFASQLDRAVPWFNPNIGTPEYFNVCAASNTSVSVPSGFTGNYQYAKTGSAYAGIWVFRTDVQNMREYMQVELLSPLQAGCHYLEFFVNAPNNFPYVSDGIGAHVSLDPVTGVGAAPFNVIPQIQNPSGNLITDTLNWTKISGYFMASGGENYLTIGNFRDDASTIWMDLISDTWYQYGSYLLVDDVTLRFHELEVDLGTDTTFCEGEVLELNAETEDAIYAWDNGSSQHIRTIVEEGLYWVDVRLDGCIDSDTILVSTEPQPFIQLDENIKLCDEQEITLHANTNMNNPIWQDGSSGTAFVTNQAGEYWVEVSNQCGVASDTLTIEVGECVCSVYIPNAFTPNGDGLNDQFKISYDCNFESFNLRIFNRWGSVIFNTSDPSIYWDGQESPMGTYSYQLLYSSEDVFTGKGLKNGSVRIIR